MIFSAISSFGVENQSVNFTRELEILISGAGGAFRITDTISLIASTIMVLLILK